MSQRNIPNHLPEEPPPHQQPSTAAFLYRIVLRAFSHAILALFTAWTLPFYLVGLLIWGRPPNVPHPDQVLRYLYLTWTEKPTKPELSLLQRIWLTQSIFRKVLVIPIWSLAWFIDEALYGRRLNERPLVAPLIKISAGRSGSTQLARYLEDDPYIEATPAVQFIFPYLWMWKLAPHTIGRFISKAEARAKIEGMVPPEMLERHETNPFKTDTFDGALYLSHMNSLSMFISPEVGIDDFGFANLAEHNRRLWEVDFVNLLDRIGRKTLLYAGPSSDGKAKRYFVKGHFLSAADALSKRYPDGRFLTMIREPAPRFRSAINFLRTNIPDPILGPVPWNWLTDACLITETQYCYEEQAWFSKPEGPKRCVLRFSNYLEDLPAALQEVYKTCLDTPELPAYAPKEHTSRESMKYSINRTLEELEIDEVALNEELADYIAWCRA